MNENNDLLPNLLHEEFEMQMRGYSRRQVDDFVARRNAEIRDLEQRVARTLDEAEHLRRELVTVRQQALAGRPAHEEVSERIAQILKLADDEAKAQRVKADDEIGKLRAEAQQESERVRADARDQAERMLTAAQEQAERTISAARNEADKTRTTARTEADRLTGETRKKADAAVASAKAQAKKVLDEATARAAAVHDGAERRLNVLSSRHGETVRRLTEILDGVQGLVAAEKARMSLEEEVNAQVSKAVAMAEAAEQEQAAREAAATAAARDAAPSLPPGGNPSLGDLTMLPPPAPETVANGAAAAGRPNGRPGTSVPDSPPLGASPMGGQSFGGPSLPPPPPPSPAPLGAGRPDSSQDGPSLPGFPPLPGGPRSGAPMPGAPIPGGPLSGGQVPGSIFQGAPARGEGLPQDRDPFRDRDVPRPGAAIDPDEPTEGIRLV